MTLQLKNINKHFDGVEILKNIALDFTPGSVTAIVGDNGAGKSTLLKIISGLYAPDAGQIVLDNADITAQDAGARRDKIDMVYQDLALARQQDVTANLFMGREICGPLGFLKRAAMQAETQQHLRALEVDIPDLNKSVGLLSGGQQQAIARAAMFNPKVLLLDEPTAALAVREVERVLELVRKQKAVGRIVILVSHRLHDVFAVADRIIVMKQGTIIHDGAAADTTMTETVERIVS
jgi:simple sugar transport system ATP-binding protein